ncbi:hypothetical protein PROFUN_12242 [Planoprotostelium fungivorum]|uniref:Uncharacterized protein n=1 Tax=Planoprotostelium fungivorum TaxID=1890364 RepID=A0A2P6N807_9EUKA|nr:hypothetical protein PROFUN_12242 [Planoprotostelium fungivorum]
MRFLLYKKYDQYKQLLDIKLRQDVSQGLYDNLMTGNSSNAFGSVLLTGNVLTRS